MAWPAPPSAAPITGPTRPAPMMPTPSRPSRLTVAPRVQRRQARERPTGATARRAAGCGHRVQRRRSATRDRARRLPAGPPVAVVARGGARAGGLGVLEQRRARHPDRGCRGDRGTRPVIVCARMPRDRQRPVERALLDPEALQPREREDRELAPDRTRGAAAARRAASRKPLRFHDSGRSSRARRGVFVYGSLRSGPRMPCSNTSGHSLSGRSGSISRSTRSTSARVPTGSTVVNWSAAPSASPAPDRRLMVMVHQPNGAPEQRLRTSTAWTRPGGRISVTVVNRPNVMRTPLGVGAIEYRRDFVICAPSTRRSRSRRGRGRRGPTGCPTIDPDDDRRRRSRCSPSGRAAEQLRRRSSRPIGMWTTDSGLVDRLFGAGDEAGDARADDGCRGRAPRDARARPRLLARARPAGARGEPQDVGAHGLGVARSRGTRA